MHVHRRPGSRMFEQRCSAAVSTTELAHCADPVQVARCRSQACTAQRRARSQACRREEGLPTMVATERHVWLDISGLGHDLENLSTVVDAS